MPADTSPRSIETIKSRTEKTKDFTMDQRSISSSTKITPVNSASPGIEAGTCERLDPYGLPLQPNPTNDHLDPLNFNQYTKLCCLLVVFIYSLLIVYSTTVYIPVTLALQTQFNASYQDISWSIATPSLGLSISPLISRPFADTYGRRIVLIISISIAIIASGCASIQSIKLSGYMAARFFQGLGTGPGLNVGLAILDDISWSHERGFRIGLWVMGTTIGAPLGLLIGGFLGEANQFWSSYHLVILYSVLLALIIITLPETLYPRDLIVAETPMALTESHITPSNGVETIKRTKNIPLWVRKTSTPTHNS
ncbi:uncharacterized protein N7518_005277 [Penicillium psychrosexuale]|uniref:uncharacterized protein n=1 Tax=Penicillium psychrosexuale TaxID=1002107 RepID=UPI00254577DA|nr:uncharacterized protein N7518_005277 [Penicillium psychrosexuale]KAJ5796737.1 hypothetical protein N7518_005277 [Penicillium psychrosexuale]